jgi:hypothetical protein
MKLNGAHYFLVYVDDVIALGGNLNTTKKTTEALVVANKDTGVEVNADTLSTWSCLRVRTQDEVTNPLKGWKSSIFGNKAK